MKVIKTIAPGSPGTQRYLHAWGKQLIAVRYPEDVGKGKVLTPLEIVVDKRPKLPRNCQQQGYLAARAKSLVALRIGFHEKSLQSQLKNAGGRWNAKHKLWITTYEIAISLGLKTRIQETSIDGCLDIDIPG